MANMDSRPDPETLRLGSLGLGDLEMAVLEALWRDSVFVTPREVLEGLKPERTLAYTTVQTVLEKLRRKGWARRRPDGRGFAYAAEFSREETAARVLRSLLHEAGDVDVALLHFVRQASSRQQDVLRAALGDNADPQS